MALISPEQNVVLQKYGVRLLSVAALTCGAVPHAKRVLSKRDT